MRGFGSGTRFPTAPGKDQQTPGPGTYQPKDMKDVGYKTDPKSGFLTGDRNLDASTELDAGPSMHGLSPARERKREICSCGRQVQAGRQRLHELKVELEKTQGLLRDTTASNRAHTANVQRQDNELRALHAEVAQLKATNRKLEADDEQAAACLTALHVELNTSKSRCQALDHEHALLAGQLAAAQLHLAEAQAASLELVAWKAQAELDLQHKDSLVAQLAQVEGQLQQVSAELTLSRDSHTAADSLAQQQAAQLAELQSQILQMGTLHAELQGQLAVQEQTLQHALSSINAKEDSASALRTEVAQQAIELLTASTALGSAQHNCQQLQAQLGDTLRQLSDLQQQHASASSQSAAMEQQHMALTAQHVELQAQHGTLRQGHEELLQQHSMLTDSHAALQQQHHNLTQECAECRLHCNTLTEECQQLAQKLTSAAAANGTLVAQLASATNDLLELQSQHAATQADLVTAHGKLANVVSEHGKLQELYAASKCLSQQQAQQLQDCTTQARTLQEEHAALQAVHATLQQLQGDTAASHEAAAAASAALLEQLQQSNTALLVQVQDLQATVKAHASERQAAGLTAREVKEEVHRLQGLLASKDTAITSQEATLQRMQSHVKSTEAEYRTCRAELTEALARLAQMEPAHKALAGELSSTTSQLQQAQQHNTQLGMQLTQLTHHHKSEKERLEAELAARQEEAIDLAAQCSVLQEQLSEESVLARKLTAEVHGLRSTLDLMCGEAATTQEDIMAAHEERDQVRNELAQAKAAVTAMHALEAEVSELFVKLAAAEQRAQAAQTSACAAERQAEELRVRVPSEDLDEKAHQLSRQLERAASRVFEAEREAQRARVQATAANTQLTEMSRLVDENKALSQRVVVLERDIKELASSNAAGMLGHNNAKQKIHYHLRLKTELEELRTECTVLLREKFSLEQAIRFLAVRVKLEPSAASSSPLRYEYKYATTTGDRKTDRAQASLLLPHTMAPSALFSTPIGQRAMRLAARGRDSDVGTIYAAVHGGKEGFEAAIESAHRRTTQQQSELVQDLTAVTAAAQGQVPGDSPTPAATPTAPATAVGVVQTTAATPMSAMTSAFANGLSALTPELNAGSITAITYTNGLEARILAKIGAVCTPHLRAQLAVAGILPTSALPSSSSNSNSTASSNEAARQGPGSGGKLVTWNPSNRASRMVGQHSMAGTGTVAAQLAAVAGRHPSEGGLGQRKSAGAGAQGTTLGGRRQTASLRA